MKENVDMNKLAEERAAVSPEKDPPPEWLLESKVNEVAFCQELLQETPMICYKGSFFTVDGRIGDERDLKKQLKL